MRQLRSVQVRRVTYPVWVWLVVLFLVAYMMGCHQQGNDGSIRETTKSSMETPADGAAGGGEVLV